MILRAVVRNRLIDVRGKIPDGTWVIVTPVRTASAKAKYKVAKKAKKTINRKS